MMQLMLPGATRIICIIYYRGLYLIGPMVYIENYIFNHFYRQHLVLLTMVPRNSNILGWICTVQILHSLSLRLAGN